MHKNDYLHTSFVKLIANPLTFILWQIALITITCFVVIETHSNALFNWSYQNIHTAANKHLRLWWSLKQTAGWVQLFAKFRVAPTPIVPVLSINRHVSGVSLVGLSILLGMLCHLIHCLSLCPIIFHHTQLLCSSSTHCAHIFTDWPISSSLAVSEANKTSHFITLPCAIHFFWSSSNSPLPETTINIDPDYWTCQRFPITHAELLLLFIRPLLASLF